MQRSCVLGRHRPKDPTRRCFWRDTRGVTAIELALVGPFFLALAFAILQTALIFWAQQVLETNVADGARLILTGQTQNNPNLKSDNERFLSLRDAICDRGPVVMVGSDECKANLHLDVRVLSSFNDADLAVPIEDGQLKTDGFGYQNSSGSQIVLVRAILEIPVYLTFMNPGLANLANGSRAIMATAAFRTEPF
ncbi:TadE/TadG family type IV pilus assembly protein [Chelatococcus sp. GCM10030263]|uniref:TadE/TadG family type IV pilus assembly protein n=1 Tax=Chelatococcus sp. GCM10030263 TaxID=3273387 RepID=UPI00362459F5